MLSILIVNWNTRDLLDACLRSIATHPPSSSYEVVVVDNKSTDRSAEMVREKHPWVRLVASEVNTGYAAGNNLAFAAASGDFLLTLNPDTEFLDDSLDRALAILQANPKVGCMGVKQIGVDGNVQSSVRGWPSVIGIMGDLTGLGKKKGGTWDSYRYANFDYTKEQLAPQPMGTFLLFRREALPHAKHPFDEGFPIFFNEVDLLYRMKLSGWDCMYTPNASIKHYGGESTKQVKKSMIWESHRSLVRYLRKHAGTGLSRLGLPFVAAAIYAAAFVRAKGYHAGFRT